jgi:hypothetical protein
MPDEHLFEGTDSDVEAMREVLRRALSRGNWNDGELPDYADFEAFRGHLDRWKPVYGALERREIVVARFVLDETHDARSEAAKLRHTSVEAKARFDKLEHLRDRIDRELIARRSPAHH